MWGTRVQAQAAAATPAVALENATVAFGLADQRVYTAVDKATLSPAGGSVRIFDQPLTGLNPQA
eukprot:gene68056-93248_t